MYYYNSYDLGLLRLLRVLWSGYKDNRRVARGFPETMAGFEIFRNRELMEWETVGIISRPVGVLSRYFGGMSDDGRLEAGDRRYSSLLMIGCVFGVFPVCYDGVHIRSGYTYLLYTLNISSSFCPHLL